MQQVALPGDHHLLEDRRATSALLAAVASTLGRQLSPHTSWLRKLRPAGGQRARTAAAGAGRPASGGGPVPGQGREAGAGGAGGAAVGAGALPPVYPR